MPSGTVLATDPALEITEVECEELAGLRIVEAVFNLYGNAYVLTDGELKA